MSNTSRLCGYLHGLGGNNGSAFGFSGADCLWQGESLSSEPFEADTRNVHLGMEKRHICVVAAPVVTLPLAWDTGLPT